MARISKQDAAFLDRFHSGAEPRAYTYFGAHQTRKRTGEEGVTFRVWAPNATGVSVVGISMAGIRRLPKCVGSMTRGSGSALSPGCRQVRLINIV